MAPRTLSRRIALLIAAVFVSCSISILGPAQIVLAQVSGPYQFGSAAVPTPVAVVASAPAQVSLIQQTISAVKGTITAANSIITANNSSFQFLKGTTLDPLAWAVSKAVLQSVVNSTIQWINSGFKGAPAFATNLSSTLQTVSDAQANSFIQQLSTNSAIKSPFQNQVASAVSTNYFQSTGSNGFFSQNPYTLNQTTSNDAAFLAGNFSQGGWDAWLSTSMNSPNNPYGAALLAQNALGSQVTTAAKNQTTELNWGSGFLSQKNCPTTSTAATSGVGAAVGTAVVGQFCTAGNQCQSGSCIGGACAAGTAAASTPTASLTSGNSSVVCSLGSIITPGTLISGAGNKAVGSGVDTLVSAKSFDQIVGALLGQLVNQVLGPGGLTGISQPSATTGGTTYFNQSTTGTTATNVDTALASSFSSTVTTQVTQLQEFVNEWSTINAAATAAQQALEISPCASSTVATAIATNVEPVITEATTEIAQGNATITALNNIENELPAANSTTDDTTQVAQASSDYSTLLGSNTIPSDTDIQNAVTQSTDTSAAAAGTATSLLTQMNEIAAGAPTCQITPTTVTPTTSSSATVTTPATPSVGTNL